MGEDGRDGEEGGEDWEFHDYGERVGWGVVRIGVFVKGVDGFDDEIWFLSIEYLRPLCEAGSRTLEKWFRSLCKTNMFEGFFRR